MPTWIRVVFLKYLPLLLVMRRPKKTRLRWMMEVPGGGGMPAYGAGSPVLGKPPGAFGKTKVELMELSDIHHPNCKVSKPAHSLVIDEFCNFEQTLLPHRG
jgi:nicotinic acetylcholine receptor